MNRSWKALLIVLICLLSTAFAHNIDVQVWLPAAPLSARDSTAWETLKDIAQAHQFTVDSSSNPVSMEMSNLQNSQVILFLNRNGDDLSAAQRQDVETFVQAGGGFVAIHEGLLSSASWSAFDSIVGAQPGSLIPAQTTTLLNADKAHPATHDLPYRYDWSAALYDFTKEPREYQSHVLLSARILPGSSLRGEHPVSWARMHGRGRIFATTLGAAKADFEQNYFQDHLLGAIEWAGGAIDGDARVADYKVFDQSILADNIEACMAIDVAADGRVFYAEKKGRVYQWNPQNQTSKLVLDWSNTGPNHRVYFPFENGIFGLALAPDFPTTPYLYIHYSYTGTDPWGPGVGQQRVSRLLVIGDSVDQTSEEILIEYDFDRDAQIHSAGCLAFDPAGNLLIAAGDNTNYGLGATQNPYNPIDQRPGNALYDAQRTSANTASLRGKILRIRPSTMIGGGYSLPAGNLFPATDSTLGEIYMMGVRNPFKICVNPANGWLAWGDVGPDAVSYDSLRGPIGHDEFNVASQAGNYGWPYILADNYPFREYDFGTQVSGDWFDPNNLTNNSPNNTGKKRLPPAQPAAMWMQKTIFTPAWPELGNGNVTAMAGAFYQYDSTILDPNKLPAYYDDKLFIMDWTRNWIKEVTLDSAGAVVKVSPFLDSLKFAGPMDLKVGPDGALYLMEWRSDKWGGTTSRISRLRYSPEGRSPVAMINASTDNGYAPLAVQFDGSQSFDPDQLTLTYRWDFGDGSAPAVGVSPSHSFMQTGVYTIRLEVENSDGKTGISESIVTVGNSRADVQIELPVHGGLFGWQEQVDFRFSVQDREDGSTRDGSIDCAAAVGQVLLGHDAHAHPSVPFTDCDGFFSASSEGHVTDEDELYLLFEASYTDTAPSGSGRLTASALHLLHPKQKQAEHYTFAKGVSRVPTLDDHSVEDIAIEADSAWFAIDPLNLYKINSFHFRLSGSGGKVELWKGALGQNGQLVASTNLPATGSDSDFVTTTPVSFVDPTGTDIYYFLFLPTNNQKVARVNWVEFSGAGVSVANDEIVPQPEPRVAPIRWTLLPNPARSLANLVVQGKPGPLLIELMDSQGRSLQNQSGNIAPGADWKTSLRLEGLAPGVYFVRIAQGSFHGLAKLVVL
ncbi:MAG: ThuA domain-containing protein [Bacteroidia bacterium]